MPTEQWLKDNPKAIAYLPKVVHKRLKDFSAEHKFSVSEAITVILQDYFKLKPQPSPFPDNARHDAELTELRRQVESLKAIVTELQKQYDTTKNVDSVTTVQVTDQASTPVARELSFSANLQPTVSPEAGKSRKSGKPRALTDSSIELENSKDREEESPVLKTTRLTPPIQSQEEQAPSSEKRKRSKDEEKRSHGWGGSGNPLHGLLSKINPQLKGRQPNKALGGTPSSRRPALPPPSD